MQFNQEMFMILFVSYFSGFATLTTECVSHHGKHMSRQINSWNCHENVTKMIGKNMLMYISQLNKYVSGNIICISFISKYFI